MTLEWYSSYNLSRVLHNAVRDQLSSGLLPQDRGKVTIVALRTAAGGARPLLQLRLLKSGPT